MSTDTAAPSPESAPNVHPKHTPDLECQSPTLTIYAQIVIDVTNPTPEPEVLNKLKSVFGSQQKVLHEL